MITARHFSRRPIAELSTYYPHKADFVPLADRILNEYGWALGAFEMPGDADRTLAPVVDEQESEVGQLCVAWYKMPSGRYELTLYLT